jgi:hypothetical protein
MLKGRQAQTKKVHQKGAFRHPQASEGSNGGVSDQNIEVQ